MLAKTLTKRPGTDAGLSSITSSVLQRHALGQRKTAGDRRRPLIPSIVHEVLRSPGQPLDARTRESMEGRFDFDFSRVRVHTDAKAAHSASAIRARAYAVDSQLVFSPRRYQPGTPEGRRLLAHELTHVVQQGPGPTSRPRALRMGPSDDEFEREGAQIAENFEHLKSASRIGRSRRAPSGVLRREPGVDVGDSWSDLVATRQTDPPTEANQQAMARAESRFLGLSSAISLVNRLWKIFCGGKKGCVSRINLFFVDQVPGEGSDTRGFFDPEWPNQPLYDVYTRIVLPEEESSGTTPSHRRWPGGTSAAQVWYTHRDPESDMAATLYHELLHVWFIHKGRPIAYRTGHGIDPAAGEVEAEFIESLREVHRDLDKLEADAKAKAEREAETRRREEAARREAEAANRPPPAVREPETEPSSFAGEVSLRGGVQGGAATGDEAPFSGVLGADLILDKIHALRIGARGVYMTPGRLLAGGSIGLRSHQQDDDSPLSRPVENPLFFDIEAGILVELSAGDAERITNNLAGLGSVGIGQVYGREGTRAFWRIGGYVIVTDRGETSYGGTLGGGVSF